MRLPRFAVAALLVAALAPVPARAATCFICDPTLHCTTCDEGGRFCLQTSYSCSLLMPCFGGPVRMSDSGGSDMTVFSLFDAGAPTATGVRHDAGAPAFGEGARALAGRPAGLGALTELGLAFGDEFAVSLVNDGGDGFALRRTLEGDGVRFEVRDVAGERPGRMLASEHLGPRDQLVVPVRIGGRDRVLLLQSERVHGAARAEEARLQRELHEAGRGLGPPSVPLYRVRPQ